MDDNVPWDNDDVRQRTIYVSFVPCGVTSLHGAYVRVTRVNNRLSKRSPDLNRCRMLQGFCGHAVGAARQEQLHCGVEKYHDLNWCDLTSPLDSVLLPNQSEVFLRIFEIDGSEKLASTWFVCPGIDFAKLTFFARSEVTNGELQNFWPSLFVIKRCTRWFQRPAPC